jgi:hypothetical protein
MAECNLNQEDIKDLGNLHYLNCEEKVSFVKVSQTFAKFRNPCRVIIAGKYINCN